MKTSIAIIISGIVIAISIVVSTKMYVDANKYTFISENKALTQNGELYHLNSAYDGERGIVWEKLKNIKNNLP